MNLNDARYAIVPARVKSEPFVAWLEEVSYSLPHNDWLARREAKGWILTLYEWFTNDVPACDAAQEIMGGC